MILKPKKQKSKKFSSTSNPQLTANTVKTPTIVASWSKKLNLCYNITDTEMNQQIKITSYQSSLYHMQSQKVQRSKRKKSRKRKPKNQLPNLLIRKILLLFIKLHHRLLGRGRRLNLKEKQKLKSNWKKITTLQTMNSSQKWNKWPIEEKEQVSKWKKLHTIGKMILRLRNLELRTQ